MQVFLFILLSNLNNINASKNFDFYRKMTKRPSPYKVKFAIFANQSFFYIAFFSFNDYSENKKKTYAYRHKSSKIKRIRLIRKRATL